MRVSGNKVLRETAELKSNHAAGNEPQNTSILSPRSKRATEWNYISRNDEDAMRWSCSAGERDKSYCKIVVWKLLECSDYWNWTLQRRYSEDIRKQVSGCAVPALR